MAAFLDACRFVPSAGGTADFTVAAPVQGYNSPALAGAVNGRVYKYRAESADLAQWEIGEGVYNIGTGVLTRATVLFNSSGTGTASGQSGAGTKINFSAAPQVAIVALKEDLLSIEEDNALTTTQQNRAQKNIGLPAALLGYLAGLTMSTAGASTTFTVAAGVATDSTTADMLTLSSAISKTTGAWAVGSGSGGLDTGAIANSTWYHVYLIKRADTQVVDALISLSPSSPTLPTNYTLYRRIGAMKTNSAGQWTRFVQVGDEFIWDVPVKDIDVNTLGTAVSTFGLASVPTGFKVNALVRGYVFISGSNCLVAIFSPDEAGITAVNVPTGNITIGNPSGSLAGQFTLNVRTNTSGQIKAVSSLASTTLTLVTYGWVDRRGRDG